MSEFKVVPTIPTEAMIEAGQNVNRYAEHDAKEVYQAMLNAAPTPAHVGWISVKERLPDKDQEVLIFANSWGEKHITSATFMGLPDYLKGKPWWSGNGWSGYEWEWDFNEDHISHWMPLPPPPEEQR